MKRITLIFLAIFIAGCSTPAIIVKENVHLETLKIYYEPGKHSNEYISARLENQLDDFIARYNLDSKRKLKLERTDNPLDSETLTIKLIATQLVTPRQQSAGVAFSMIGLSLPFMMASLGAPVYVFFYYFPQARSATELSLSPDIRGPGQLINPAIHSSPGFLMSPEKQINKHTTHFDRFLGQVLKGIETGVK